MNRPLYSINDEHIIINNQAPQCHQGLWFERFFDRFDMDWQIPNPTQDNDPKRDWINTVTTKNVGDDPQLEQYALRQIALCRHLNGSQVTFSTDWHFITGMGNPHPVENGFSWHPTLAVPFLSGASIKGLVRAWVETGDEALEDSEKKNRLKQWFGTENKGDVAEQAGQFIFFDAVPVNKVALVCDIMTPHMNKWYERGGEDPETPEVSPADWHDPVPVPFLAVKNATLLFTIVPRVQGLEDELKKVLMALKEALTWLGVGAKTATGYGFFSDEPKDIRYLNSLQDDVSLTDEEKRIAALEQSLTNAIDNGLHLKPGDALYTLFKETIEQSETWDAKAQSKLKKFAKDYQAYVDPRKRNRKIKTLKAIIDNRESECK